MKSCGVAATRQFQVARRPSVDYRQLVAGARRFRSDKLSTNQLSAFEAHTRTGGSKLLLVSGRRRTSPDRRSGRKTIKIASGTLV